LNPNSALSSSKTPCGVDHSQVFEEK